MIPLCFNTIYYVECPDNEELNLFVQHCFSEDLNATLPRDLRKIQYRFHYLTQKELQPDNLRKHFSELGEDNNTPATDATIDFLRECLYADTGGYLVARQLTKISDKDDEKDKIGVEEHLITFPLLKANDKEEDVKRLLRALAKLSTKKAVSDWTTAGTSMCSKKRWERFPNNSYLCRRMRKRNGFTSNCQPL